MVSVWSLSDTEEVSTNGCYYQRCQTTLGHGQFFSTTGGRGSWQPWASFHLHSENSLLWEPLKGHLPPGELRGDSSRSSSGSGVGVPSQRGGHTPGFSGSAKSHYIFNTLSEQLPLRAKLGSRDVPEPLRWVLCLPAVAWPAQRTNFVSQFYSFCNFASNTCPIKYSNIKEMSNLENETPLSPTQITYS